MIIGNTRKGRGRTTAAARLTFLTLLVISVIVIATTSASLRHKPYPKKFHARVMAELKKRRASLRSNNIDSMGSWGAWGPWTPCSRSCGSGVASQERQCKMKPLDRSRSKYGPSGTNRCVGRYKRFQLCNTQNCRPFDVPLDFRSQQCSSFNRTPFKGKFYSWVPYIEDTASCVLNCRAVGLGFYATLNQSVIDGTPCGDHRGGRGKGGRSPKWFTIDQKSVCVEGKCTVIGCDGLLGSNKRWDACGVCMGDNSTCTPIFGIHSRGKVMPHGFNLITTIPSGAVNVSIVHLKPTMNYLALREVNGRYILNGPRGGPNSTGGGGFEDLGTIFTYSKATANRGDAIAAKGPTKTSVDVMVFYQGPDPGIKYEYRLPNNDRQRHVGPYFPPPLTRNREGLVNDARRRAFDDAEDDRLLWWKKTQGEDKNKMKKKIEREEKEKKKEEKERRYLKKLQEREEVKEMKRRRRHRWVVSGFTPCSQSCGGGTQMTTSMCVKKKKSKTEVPLRFCHGLPPPKEQIVRCNLRPCPAKWEPNPWGDCSVSCGLGLQTRNMSCKQRVSADLTIDLPEDECHSIQSPPVAQVCQMRDCNAKPSWDVGPWGPCLPGCGIGTRRREVVCSDAGGVVNGNMCSATAKPPQEETCDMGSCAIDTWFFTDWRDACVGSCDAGYQTRRTVCSGNAFSPRGTPGSCSEVAQPPERRSCVNRARCQNSWFTGPWSECSAECGSGRQTRSVLCVRSHNGRFRVSKDPSSCEGAGEKPLSSQLCVVDCTPQWFTSEWSECSATCEGGIQRREIKCLDGSMDASLECDRESKPDSRRTCNELQPCLFVELSNKTAYDVIITDGDENLPNDEMSANLLEEEETNERANKQSKDPSCQDKMDNCHLVYKARLCPLEYYNRLCCETCERKEDNSGHSSR